MTLPLLISVPHAGLKIPQELISQNRLTLEEIVHDGDEGASAIYDIEEHVQVYVTTDIARAYVDMNRSPDDVHREDGVVKTHTCWQVPVYEQPLDSETTRSLIHKYHRPYHETLSRAWKGTKLGLDCHTMAAFGPPIAPDPGQERPAVCLGNADGTCPDLWASKMAEFLADSLGYQVTINTPFAGGYIVRNHAKETPWLQVEFSRAPFLPNDEKRRCFLEAITRWCKWAG